MHICMNNRQVEKRCCSAQSRPSSCREESFQNKRVKRFKGEESQLYQKYGLISESWSLLVSNTAPHFFETEINATKWVSALCWNSCKCCWWSCWSWRWPAAAAGREKEGEAQQQQQQQQWLLSGPQWSNKPCFIQTSVQTCAGSLCFFTGSRL